nr:adenine phosphoribosyltransferase [Kutzneria albida]
MSGALGLIREVPDFPEPGVLFRDINPVLADPAAFRVLTDALASGVAPGTEVLVAVEARGFLLGAAMAYAMGLGLVCVRKPGKLPAVEHRVDYALEYGTATLELPATVVRAGQRVAIVDDVLATGGTVTATKQLVEHCGARVTGVHVVFEIAALAARDRLGVPVHALLTD